jgi:epoxyqueuosine reductase
VKKILWSERIKSPPKALTFETYLREQDNPISSHPEAREPRIVPLVVFDYGSVMARIRQMRYVGKYLVASVKEMAKSAKSVVNNPYAGKMTIDAESLKDLEEYAHSLGVTDIGYTRVNPRHIFRGYKLLFPHAIVFTMEMNREKIKQAPSMPSFYEIFRTYLQLGVIVNQISEFLRQLGYNVLAGPAIGGDVNYIPRGSGKNTYLRSTKWQFSQNLLMTQNSSFNSVRNIRSCKKSWIERRPMPET